MPVIVFLIDNSASMNQMTYIGTTLFDLAKGAIEQFLKIRQRDVNAVKTDRYMLLTLDDPPTNVKVGWKEPMTVFVNSLKNLEATGFTNMGPAIKQCFDLLNLNKHAAEHDTYGMGRFPHLLEPSLIIVITDKQKLTSPVGVQNEINIPMNTGPVGSELTKEPFRWDQRLFAVVLGLGSQPITDQLGNQFIPQAIECPINAMCDVTGGRSYLISSQKTLTQCLESLVQKIQTGVVVSFEKVNDDGTRDDERSIWHTSRKMIMIPKSIPKTEFNWPIPEDYWPSMTALSLPSRTAHPTLKFQCQACEAAVMDKFPFDKYELEPSPLTQHILERRQPSTAWQVFVQGSSRLGPQDLGSPFGYLKASSNLQSVNLYVMPYNYHELFALLDDLTKDHRLKTTKQWQSRFDQYLRNIPPYYLTPLKRALARKQLQFIFEQFEKMPPSILSPNILQYLKKVKIQAKTDLERWPTIPDRHAVYIHLLPTRQDCVWDRSSSFDQDLLYSDNEFQNFVLYPKADKQINPPQVYLNVFDIPRSQLISTIEKMRSNLLGSLKLQDEDALHSIPIKEMGNYDEYPRNQQQPLREIESQPVRQHVFGNPFKVNKPIDEIDECAGSSSQMRKRPLEQQTINSKNKKRTTLILKNYVYRRNFPLLSPPSSPASSVGDESDIGEPSSPRSPLNDIIYLDTPSSSLSLSASALTTNSELAMPVARFTFDLRGIINDEHRRMLKKYRDTKKLCKNILKQPYQDSLVIFSTLDELQLEADLKLTLVDDLIRECQRLKPELESRLQKYRMHIASESSPTQQDSTTNDELNPQQRISDADYSVIQL
ncbi:unnamed protein product [Didymodactylos carnosus]|uniref:VWFA domain-containing protein n=1 Tax=Didymodactylos carnosus TaxID=1234261 RepID=A0A814F184_9BILA|nr:unnamed protein product [Didymodactylos carnosus]CAF0975081.1 unnamed protein product [Didymodactylos carnosus]CAF3644893.1 unnamed protein product [Didymodactylos carnosus]CAF3747922.1 unnamed protein product [Didymodactylos carnosus]